MDTTVKNQFKLICTIEEEVPSKYLVDFASITNTFTIAYNIMLSIMHVKQQKFKKIFFSPNTVIST